MANDTDSIAGIELDTSKLPAFLGCKHTVELIKLWNRKKRFVFNVSLKGVTGYVVSMLWKTSFGFI